MLNDPTMSLRHKSQIPLEMLLKVKTIYNLPTSSLSVLWVKVEDEEMFNQPWTIFS